MVADGGAVMEPACSFEFRHGWSILLTSQKNLTSRSAQFTSVAHDALAKLAVTPENSPSKVAPTDRPTLAQFGDLGALSSLICKNISVRRLGKSLLQFSPSRPTEGRLAIVTNAGRDAVDADGASDESA
jgi:hypothetical protein